MANQQHSRRPFGLRMPDDLKDWLISRAEENGRSVNSEIVQLLKSEWQRETAKSAATVKRGFASQEH